MQLPKSTQAMTDFANLVTYAFDKTLSVLNEEKFHSRYQHGLCFGSYHNNQLTNGLMINLFPSYLNHHKLQMAGVGYVASDPIYRGQGSIKALFDEVLQYLYEKQVAYAQLAPFSAGFYRQFGFEEAFYQKQYRFGFDAFERTNFQHDLHLKRGSYDELLADIQTVYQKAHQGGLWRENWWWQRLHIYYPNRFYVVIYDEIHPVGYLIYRKMGSTFQVEELIYLHFNALKASLQYIKSHQSTFQEVTICESIQERLEWLFPEQKRIEIKICPYMMKRILHIEQILTQYEALKSLVIQVTQDDICSQNVGYWQYHGDSWQKTTAKEADLSADITTFSALLLGELTVDEAIFTQRLQASAKAQKLKLPSLNQQFFDYY